MLNHALRRAAVAALAAAATLAVVTPAKAAVREYWIAAVAVPAWNIVPNGQDAITGEQFDPSKTIVPAVVYRAYTPHWQRPLPAPYGGIPGPTIHARVGDVVQWDVLALGDDHHTFHVHGHRWLKDGVPIDVQTVGPAESFKIRWREDRAGTWLYHCHVESHMMNGMIGLYRVAPR